MATLTTKLTLQSADATSDTLSLSATDDLTVGAPSVSISRVSIEATGGSDTILKPAGSAGNHYLYVKHTGKQGDGTTDATGAVVLKLASTSLSVLVPGEWCFFNVINSGVINAIASSSHTILVEYGYWTKS
jgi:hypothetical protein|tara:strand:- start:607 stop:999 length:393 start_codon:yes stop_codon:yes gene_type:complete